MEKKKNTTKIIIILLVVIILLLIGFIIFFAKEILEERKDIRRIYNDGYNTNKVNNNTTNNSTTTNSNYISRDEALQIALENVPTNKESTYDIDIELDYKYGKTVYEVNFNYQQYEFEYYIDAENGSIIKSFRERD